MLPKHLRDIQEFIRGVAIDYGLDFFDTIFEVVDYQQINEIAAFGGFPTRYPHWRFGMEYEQLSKSAEYGLSKIYEMVINNDPSYAYLLEGNNLVDQKTVIAHVYAHVDFFKNNYWFSKTNRKMMDQMANHGSKVRRYVDSKGIELVEDFIDTCLSLENLIDFHSPFIERNLQDTSGEEGIPKMRAKEYMEDYINPEEYLAQQKEKLLEQELKSKKFPSEPERDVMAFLVNHAPLEAWESDILSMIRDEAYYFAPQMQTKIMNEGWASFWHEKMLTQKVLLPSEIIDFADIHSGVLATSQGQLNPYKLGVELYQNIEDRWNKGMFGPEWAACDSMAERANWDKDLGLGRAKIFEVRKLYNDVSFIDEFLTPEFAIEQKMFTYGFNKKSSNWEIQSREFMEVKEKLLTQLTNSGNPYIYVKDGNFRNRSELLLHHKYLGTTLDINYAKGVLKALHRVWKRPVNLETLYEDEGLLLAYDGTQYLREKITYEAL